MEFLVRVAFYLIVGLALLLASFWYVGALYKDITGKGEVVIAPFEVIGSTDSKGLGVGLAHMLHHRLLDIERDIRLAQSLSSPSPSPPNGNGESPAAKPEVMPQLLTRAVDLRINPLDPAEINVSVGGVEVGGILPWVQRFMAAPRSLELTLYESKGGTQVFGTLRALNLSDEGMRIVIPASQSGQDSVSMDKVVDAVAFEIARRRRAEKSDTRLRVFDGAEFQALVEILRDTTLLNQRVANGRGALPEFQELQSRATRLADQVPDWYPLTYLAANIAESAKDLETARRYYELARQVAIRNGDPAHQEKYLTDKLAALQRLLADVQPAGQATGALQDAKKAIRGYVRTGTDFLNALLGHNLPAPQVQLMGNDDPTQLGSYWDGQKVVLPPATQFIPDIAYREASWPHIMRVVGSDAVDFDDGNPMMAILYAYADIFPMLVQQEQLHQDAKTSRWELGHGWQEYHEGQDVSTLKKGTPYLSFSKLGQPGKQGKQELAYAGHMRDYDTTGDRAMRKYINSGIIDRAFYETAIRMGSQKAATIWINALRALKTARKVDFQKFARLLDEAGEEADRAALRDALGVVGLAPQVKTAAGR